MFQMICEGLLAVAVIASIGGLAYCLFQLDKESRERLDARWKALEDRKKASKRERDDMRELADMLDEDRANGILPHKDFWKDKLR